MPASHQAPEAYFEPQIGILWDVIIRPEFKGTMVKLFNCNPTIIEDDSLQSARALRGIHSPLDQGLRLPCLERDWTNVLHFLCFVTTVIVAKAVGLPRNHHSLFVDAKYTRQ